MHLVLGDGDAQFLHPILDGGVVHLVLCIVFVDNLQLNLLQAIHSVVQALVQLPVHVALLSQDTEVEHKHQDTAHDDVGLEPECLLGLPTARLLGRPLGCLTAKELDRLIRVQGTLGFIAVQSLGCWAGRRNLPAGSDVG